MAEWIGFTVGREDSLSVGKIQEIIGWCAGPKIVLEVAENTDPAIIQSYISVLPVDAIELDIAQLEKYAALGETSGLQWILLGEPTENQTTHSHEFHSGNHITNVSAILNNPAMVMDKEPFAISVDCVNAENPALKSYDEWSDFFEALGIF